MIAKAVLILQARMGSTRLPGKSMMDLAGAPMLGRILERVKRCKRIDDIVLATTDLAEDDVLADLANEYAVNCFRGSETDVLDRYYQAAKSFGADIIVRLPADNATPEPGEIDRIVDYHRESDNAFSSNLAQVMGNGYPDGIGAEAISFWALEKAWQECQGADMREHPHLCFFDYQTQQPVADTYKVGTVECPVEFRRPDLVLDVNLREQYDFMRELYESLYPDTPDFHITDIIRWYDHIYAQKK